MRSSTLPLRRPMTLNRRVSRCVSTPKAVATGVKRSYRSMPAAPQQRSIHAEGSSPPSGFPYDFLSGQPTLRSTDTAVTRIRLRSASPLPDLKPTAGVRQTAAAATVAAQGGINASVSSVIAPRKLKRQEIEQAAQRISHHAEELLGQAVATAVQAAQTAPTVARALAQVVSGTTAFTAAAVSSPLQAIMSRASDDLRCLQRGFTDWQERIDTAKTLKAKVAALEEERDSLASELREAEERLSFAEALSSTLSVQLEERKAWQSLDNATQIFRRHVGKVPASFSHAVFTEKPEDIIGKGGCATVYRWAVDGSDTEWAVKCDPISYRYTYGAAFDPQRCGDLLPAFLPSHSNILAPRAWWVKSLAPPAAVPQEAALPPVPSPGFQLFTLYERYTCSLWDYMQALSQAPSSATRPQLLLDIRSLLTIIRDVAAALDHLALHRVVHGDLKMENILLELEPTTEASANAAPAKLTGQRVAKAVLIDFGLCSTLPRDVDQVPARGGTWMFKAPEQMSGPPGVFLGGQPRAGQPHVELGTDAWALGALICMLCNNGVLPSRAGFPLSVPSDQLLKFGDRPKDGSVEPFYMLWDDVLPKVPDVSSTDGEDASVTSGCVVSDSAAEVQRAHVLALLRRLAVGCMQVQPKQRLTVAQVHEAATAALNQLCH